MLSLEHEFKYDVTVAVVACYCYYSRVGRHAWTVRENNENFFSVFVHVNTFFILFNCLLMN